MTDTAELHGVLCAMDLVSGEDARLRQQTKQVA